MNFDWFHATQVEESDNHALFFECKRRHFSIKNTTATRPRQKHSTGSTVLPLGLAQPKEQPCLLQQLSRFYLLPFPRKKLGDAPRNLVCLCTSTDLDSLHYGSPNVFREFPLSLFWTGSRAARAKIKLSGTPNHLNWKSVCNDKVLSQTCNTIILH